MQEIIKYKYDTKSFDFRSVVEKYLEFKNLEKIHQKYKFGEILKFKTDQNKHLHRKFYDAMDKDINFTKLYKKFIKEIILPNYEEEIIVQKFPTFRVHQPENLAVFAWHRDRDFNHNPKEINFYLPITKAYATNTFWYETEENKKDYMPMEADFGEVIAWPGANLEHGNKINDTGDTRISFDFRILKLSDYSKEKVKQSLTKGKQFKIGEYFDYI